MTRKLTGAAAAMIAGAIVLVIGAGTVIAMAGLGAAEDKNGNSNCTSQYRTGVAISSDALRRDGKLAIPLKLVYAREDSVGGPIPVSVFACPGDQTNSTGAKRVLIEKTVILADSPIGEKRNLVVLLQPSAELAAAKGLVISLEVDDASAETAKAKLQLFDAQLID